MSPDERQLLTGLFDRIREQSNTPRDGEAETFITEAVRAQPYAPYLLSQTVIVQDHALRAANERLQQLETRVRELESSQTQSAAPTGGSFLGNMGRSLFGDPQVAPHAAAAPPSGPWGQTAAAPRPVQPAYAPPPQPAAWGAPPQQQQQAAWSAPSGAAPGGGFLKGALGAAAGVAGGVLLADSIRGLFSGGNPYGMASGFGGGMGGGMGGGETVVNNYYDTPPDQRPDDVQNADYNSNDDSGTQNADSDNSGDWSSGDDSGGGGGDDNFNV